MTVDQLWCACCFAFTLSFKGTVVSVGHYFFCLLCQTKYCARPFSSCSYKATTHLQGLWSSWEQSSKGENFKAKASQHWFGFWPVVKYLYCVLKHLMLWWVFIGLPNGNWAVNHKYILDIEPWKFIIGSPFGRLQKLIRWFKDCSESFFLFRRFSYVSKIWAPNPPPSHPPRGQCALIAEPTWERENIANQANRCFRSKHLNMKSQLEFIFYWK